MNQTEQILQVVARDELAQGIVGLTLARADGQALPAWEAGAHIDLVLPDNGLRQYSLCGDVADRQHYRVAILREAEGRGGSRWVHDTVRVGDNLRVGGPRNHFRLVASPRYVFIAGGIGITPLLPMIAAAEAAGAAWQLVYGGRSLDTMAFADTLAQRGERVTLWPQDQRGLIDLDGLLAHPDAHTKIYCCGPEPLLQAVKGCCERKGWPLEALHVEHFSAPQAADQQVSTAFELVLAQSGKTLQVPADRSILEVVEAAGMPVRQACGVGTCGTCEVRVLEGEVDHRDCVLSDEEKRSGEYMMVCVSRAKSARLVLDL